jgi:hypothetical protein
VEETQGRLAGHFSHECETGIGWGIDLRQEFVQPTGLTDLRQ